MYLVIYKDMLGAQNRLPARVQKPLKTVECDWGEMSSLGMQ